MLNGTLVAIQRTLTCLIENMFLENTIKIPKVLQSYIGSDEIKLP
jgi:seryl-tRNA synthetase